jgi:hypothetical protein
MIKTLDMKKRLKVVVENCEPLLMNPEDKFNDLVRDGWSVNDALLSIMEDAILEKKLEEDYPDYLPDSMIGKGNGKWKVRLVREDLAW